MKKIGQFFGKFNSVAAKEIQKRVYICNIIKNEIGQEIQIDDISIRSGEVIIKGGSGLKSQIFIKKEKILYLINKEVSIRDIK
jgi:DNA-binding protein